MAGNRVTDRSLTPDQPRTGLLTPIIGVEHATSLDFDHQSQTVYWVGMAEAGVGTDDENVSGV